MASRVDARSDCARESSIGGRSALALLEMDGARRLISLRAAPAVGPAIGRTLLLAALLALAPGGVAGAQVGEYTAAPAAAPLFASDTPLEVTLEADFDALEGDREEGSPVRPGVLQLSTPSGERARLEVALRTRGNFRLRRGTCSFPNLRVDLHAGEAATVFSGQQRIKLVGHCRDSDEYEQNALEEHLVYRLYNLLTDASFRVRLARLTYVDSDGTGEPLTRYGFFIEGLDGVAARLRGLPIEAREIDPLQLDPTASAKLELFQYMIGNTDYSIVFSHNSELVRLPDGSYQAVPYDFDFAGIVDAPYATPDPSLGTESVRERVFRGFCRPGVDMAAVFGSFQERRAALEEVIRTQPGLHARNRERALAYLGEFFRTIETPRARRDLIERRCRTVPG
jgi:hypothetical protein